MAESVVKSSSSNAIVHKNDPEQSLLSVFVGLSLSFVLYLFSLLYSSVDGLVFETFKRIVYASDEAIVG